VALVVTIVLLFVLLRDRQRDRGQNILGGRPPNVMTFARDGARMTDGVIAPEGSDWNGIRASVIALGGSVEWDLGEIRKVSRAFVQADNNDRYAVLVSTNGTDFHTLFEAQAVQALGLRSRIEENLASHARFVRVEPRGGDGNYSIAELSLDPEANGPFPPALRIGRNPVHASAPLDDSLWLAGALGFLLLALALYVPRFTRRPTLGVFAATVVLSAFLGGTALVYAAKNRFNLVDDAYISLQYAKNWISGNGLVFNPGERVEGYTNFLWVALVAPLWPLSGQDPALMARLASFLTVALALVGLGLVASIGARAFSSLLAMVLALMLLAFDDSFVSYTVVFALENHLLIALLLAGVALVVYRPKWWEPALGSSFCLVAMTRPDGLLWPATFFASSVLALPFRNGRDDTVGIASLGRIGSAFAIPFMTYFLLRYWYFGEVLTNTFYLKVGDGLGGVRRGYEYLASFVTERFGVPLLALGAAVLVRAAWSRWLLLYTLLHSAYVVYVGGDFYAGHRFLLVLIPILALLTAAAADQVLTRLKQPAWQRIGAVCALLVCLALRFGTLRHGPYTTELNGWLTTVDNNVKYMRWMKDKARPNSSMVLGDIGAAGLFADLRVIDVFGVVDRTVAHKQVPNFGSGKAGHEKVATRDEQLERNPTYIKWGYVDDFRAPRGYYIFNDFPPQLHVEGLWVKDDRSDGHPLAEGAWHMVPEELAAWSRAGDAFAAAPTSNAVAGQSALRGQDGSLLNSFVDARGDEVTGRLLSPPFRLKGDRMRLLVGGGRDPERLRVSLLIQGKPVFSETGTNWETLGRREWNIAPYRDALAQIEVVDEATGVWGHILVDEIVQWSGPAQQLPGL